MLCESGFLRIIHMVELYGESEDSDYIVHHQIFHLFTNLLTYLFTNEGNLYCLIFMGLGSVMIILCNYISLMAHPVNETNRYTY